MTGRRHSRRPTLLNAVGPHPYWGGRPQALHVSIETKRRNVFDPLVAAGADINGHNDQYEHWSPLMLTFHRDQTGMRQALMERNARVGLVEAMLFEDDTAVEKKCCARENPRSQRSNPTAAPCWRSPARRAPVCASR
jgi:hypothetical protein